MATVSHTIYSHYDPKDRERLERETGQLDEKLEADQSWKTEPPKYRNEAPAPQFVPATIAYDPWSFSQASSSQQRLEMVNQTIDNHTVHWYRSLRNMLAADDETNARRPSSAPVAPPQQVSVTSKLSRPTSDSRPKRDKNNWFIMNVINSEPSSTSTTPRPPPPTLADILERDPPPKPTEPKYTPPVFLEIGPNNRGFAMLQKSGWSEGEALGPDIMRRERRTEDLAPVLFGDREHLHQGSKKRKGNIKARSLLDANQQPPGNIIDLTQSDSEESDSHIDSDKLSLVGLDDAVSAEIDVGPRASVSSAKPEPVESESVCTDGSSQSVSGATSLLTGQPVEEDLPYGRKALLTPLATVLKSDRLGIGLKAKTVGPYKASRKRITHNAAALAAHIRASEELQKKKKEHGRGRRGFEREYRREAMKRQMMLADFNS